jgi:lysophospholipase L1-like esterase
VLLAVLPVVAGPEDPGCARLYGQVAALGRRLGFETVELASAFRGRSLEELAKPGERWDLTHPSALGHRLLGEELARWVTALAPGGAPHGR